MKALLSTLLFLVSTVNALTFTVGTYNVENLFDYKYQGSEYKEFIPNKSHKWTQTKADQKLLNVVKVLEDLDLDIIALQEIESQYITNKLLEKLPQYKYSYFTKKDGSAVGLAILSRYKIISNKLISVERFNNHSRDILATTIKVDNKDIIIFNNHWRSKRKGENSRVPYALKLIKHLENLSKEQDYILLGDFNSNYDEYKTFRYNQRLNTTSGITGINHILNTINNNQFITKETITKSNEIVHFNTWLDLPRERRFSYIFRKQNETPDNIILSSALFDTQNISYIDNSFKVFKPSYLYNNGKIQRKKFSDHLPIYASFSTSKTYKKTNIQTTKLLSSLYSIESLTKPIYLKDLIVIYKDNTSAIVKQKNDRAIYFYKCAQDLTLGKSYNLTIEKIDRFNNLLEVKQFSKTKENSNYPNITDLFIDAKQINILDSNLQNEIVTNLEGIYKKRFLHFIYKGKELKIRLYAKEKALLPQENQKIKILSGHRTIFKSQQQITLHKKSDYIVMQ